MAIRSRRFLGRLRNATFTSCNNLLGWTLSPNQPRTPTDKKLETQQDSLRALRHKRTQRYLQHLA